MAAQIGTLISFSAGQVAVAADVNSNFTAIRNAYNAVISASGQVLSEPGTVSLPGHAFNGQPASGVWRENANRVGIVVGGQEILRLSDLHTDVERAVLNRGLIIYHSNGQSSSWEISRNAGADGGGGWKAGLDAGVPAVSGDRLGFYLFAGADDSDLNTLPENAAGFESYARENWGPAAHGCDIGIYVTPLGGSSRVRVGGWEPDGAYLIDVIGEFTADAGVTIDGLQIKDGAIPGLAIAATQITSGVLANARVQASNVTQHQAALSIAETQIPNGAILARVGAAETISGAWSFARGQAEHVFTCEETDDIVTADPTADAPATWIVIRVEGVDYYFPGYSN